jgi:uncharacterized protein (DUF2252 family)
MTNLNLEASLAVAEQINTTCSAMDQSISEMATLTSKIVSASRQSEMAPADSQEILQTMAHGFSQLIEGRAKFVSAHKQMIRVKQHSNHEVTDFGCWGDGPLVNPLAAKLTAVA